MPCNWTNFFFLWYMSFLTFSCSWSFNFSSYIRISNRSSLRQNWYANMFLSRQWLCALFRGNCFNRSKVLFTLSSLSACICHVCNKWLTAFVSKKKKQPVKSVWLAHAASCFIALMLVCGLETAHEFTSLTPTAPSSDSSWFPSPLIYLFLPLLTSYFCTSCSLTLSLSVLPLHLLHLLSFTQPTFHCHIQLPPVSRSH